MEHKENEEIYVANDAILKIKKILLKPEIKKNSREMLLEQLIKGELNK